MRTLNCDICRKELTASDKGRTYWHIREYDICESCKDAIELKAREIIRQHIPYSQSWYEHEIIALIEKGIKNKHP
ncbi:MAG: hypothetical protein ACTTH7_04170 [Treponema sp.]